LKSAVVVGATLPFTATAPLERSTAASLDLPNANAGKLNIATKQTKLREQ
jgi:hypothetical protein